MPDLFSSLKIRGTTFRNRVAVSPMCQYSYDDGFSNDWQLVHLGSRAVGGAALVMVEATAVEARGRITYADLGIWKGEHIPNLARVAACIRDQGAVPGIQLAHAGRKASTQIPWKGGAPLRPEEGAWETVAPSAIPFTDSGPPPKALTESEIQPVLDAFAAAAERALHAGFELIEIHGAHGYLIHEFLSPLSNQRTDGYGGSLQNRMRFAIEAVQRIRAVWPEDKPLFLRISASDWAPGGWDLDSSVELSKQVKELGVDLIDCSSGGLVPYAKIELRPGYQVPFAERIRRATDILTGAVGMITEPEQAEEIIRTERADMVLLARAMLRDPYWALHAARSQGADLAPPVQYGRAFETLRAEPARARA